MAGDNEKKKVKTAVAVAYEPGDKAPKILASVMPNITRYIQVPSIFTVAPKGIDRE